MDTLVSPPWTPIPEAGRGRTRVYVAAAQEDYLRARAAMHLLRTLGLEVTQDWTGEVAEHLNEAPTHEEWASYAVQDLQGVRDADVVLVLTPESKECGCGMWAELGIALAHGKRVILTGANRHRCLFSTMCETRRTDVEGIQAML